MAMIKISGAAELAKAFQQLSDNVKGIKLEAATRAAALPIQNRVKITVPEGGRTPYKSGTYRRSFGNEPTTTEKSPTRCTVQIGTDSPYGRRLEYGFVGRDVLGRFYNQAARPHIRPAFDENVEVSQQEFADAMRDLLMAGVTYVD